MSDMGNSIKAGLEEAIRYAEGKDTGARVHHIPRIDVKQIRKRMGLTQEQFARRFGFTVGNVRNWEQGHRQPTASTRILLAVIQNEPEAVERVLEGMGG